ncbi:hypothetical protein [Cesiribacter andamanensis]|uniref:Uncharacterized protein n=1 Tax=Cesiribacter andamanensis AMV16 TaxID=1279009 RepID=M7N044_9BACT|nr:hypothetical protein [Cesiribacter andamanensis]EMR00667.1 hypothetical protein ADICEAN_04208 [Cesiribacter andamanensis AMV16]
MERVRHHIKNSRRLRRIKHFLISIRIRNRQVSLFRLLAILWISWARPMCLSGPMGWRLT